MSALHAIDFVHQPRPPRTEPQGIRRRARAAHAMPPLPEGIVAPAQLIAQHPAAADGNDVTVAAIDIGEPERLGLEQKGLEVRERASCELTKLTHSAPKRAALAREPH